MLFRSDFDVAEHHQADQSTRSLGFERLRLFRFVRRNNPDRRPRRPRLQKDFGGIVLDEIIAFWFILLFIMPASLWMQAIAFILFRFFDAVKPGPIGYIDRYFKRVENSGESSTTLQILWRGFGIMVDDLAAALSTLLIIALLQMIGSHLGWM